jgi:hypothetical protein
MLLGVLKRNVIFGKTSFPLPVLQQDEPNLSPHQKEKKNTESYINNKHIQDLQNKNRKILKRTLPVSRQQKNPKNTVINSLMRTNDVISAKTKE